MQIYFDFLFENIFEIEWTKKKSTTNIVVNCAIVFNKKEKEKSHVKYSISRMFDIDEHENVFCEFY